MILFEDPQDRGNVDVVNAVYFSMFLNRCDVSLFGSMGMGTRLFLE